MTGTTMYDFGYDKQDAIRQYELGGIVPKYRCYMRDSEMHHYRSIRTDMSYPDTFNPLVPGSSPGGSPSVQL
jgi:hypothetical protein